MNNEVWQEISGLDLVQAEFDSLDIRRSLWLSLSGNVLSALLGLLFLEVVLSDSLEEGKSGVRVSDVLDSDVDLLGDLSLFDLFLNDDSD
jgi:hypothetical protein